MSEKLNIFDIKGYTCKCVHCGQEFRSTNKRSVSCPICFCPTDNDMVCGDCPECGSMHMGYCKEMYVPKLADYRRWVLMSQLRENKVSFWCRVKCFFIVLKDRITGRLT